MLVARWGLAFVTGGWLSTGCVSPPEPPAKATKSDALEAVPDPGASLQLTRVQFGRGFTIQIPTDHAPNGKSNGWTGATWSVIYFPVPDAELPVDDLGKATALANANLLAPGRSADPTRSEDRGGGRFHLETAPAADGAVSVVTIAPAKEWVLAVRCEGNATTADLMRQACRSIESQ